MRTWETRTWLALNSARMHVCIDADVDFDTPNNLSGKVVVEPGAEAVSKVKVDAIANKVTKEVFIYISLILTLYKSLILITELVLTRDYTEDIVQDTEL